MIRRRGNRPSGPNGRTTNPTFHHFCRKTGPFLVILAVATCLVSAAASAQQNNPAAADSQSPLNPSATPVNQTVTQPAAATHAAAQPSNIEQHLARLRDNTLDPQTRRLAAAELMQLGSPEALAALESELRNNAAGPDRLLIAQALLETAAPPARLIEALLELLAESDPELRRTACEALANYQDARTTTRLIELATDTDTESATLRTGAIEALASIRSHAAAQTLVTLAASPEPTITRHAIDSLIRMTGQAQLGHDSAAWAAWWADASQVPPHRCKTYLLSSLAQTQTSIAVERDGLRARLTESQNRLYGAMSEEARITLLTQLLDDPLADLRMLALNLIERRILNAQPVDESLRRRIRTQLTTGSRDERQEAASVLETLADESGAALAANALADETDTEVRAAYLGLIARSPKPQAITTALNLLQDERLRGPATRVVSAAADAKLLTEQQLNQALQIARNHIERASAATPDNNNTADNTTTTLIRFLGKFGPITDMPLLTAALESGTNTQRLAAAEALEAEPWPLDPLSARLNDAVVGPIAMRAVTRRGKTDRTLLRLIEAEPQQVAARTEWLESIRTIASRLDTASLTAADDALAAQPNKREPREAMLTAAITRAPANNNGESTNATNTNNAIPRRTEARLRLAKLYITANQPSRAAAVYQQIETQGDLGVAFSQRLRLGRINLALSENKPDDAELLTRSAFESQTAPSAEALAEPWLQAIETARTNQNPEAAANIALRASDLFEGRLSQATAGRLQSLRIELNTRPAPDTNKEPEPQPNPAESASAEPNATPTRRPGR